MRETISYKNQLEHSTAQHNFATTTRGSDLHKNSHEQNWQWRRRNSL